MALTIISQPPQLILSKQPVAFTVQSDSIATPLRIKGNVSGSTDADSVAADVDKQASFELSDYLQALITSRYKMSDTPAVYTNVPSGLQFEFSELAGSPPVLAEQLVSGAFYLLDGYVPKARRKALYAAYASLLAYLDDSKKFISWWPLNTIKEVLPDQKEFLNYLQLYSETPITLDLEVTLNFTDGSDLDMSGIFAPVTGVSYMQMVYFPTGYTQLGIEAFIATNAPGKTLDYYTIYIGAGGLLVSDYQKYRVDYTYYANVRYLYIRNSFGLLEIVRCTGQGEQTNSLKIEMVRTDGRILPDKINWKIDKSDTVKVNTGFLTAAQIQWLSDMDFLEAYELVNGVLLPIVFKDIDIPVLHDQVYQYSAELEYEYAFNETTEEG